MSTSLQSTSTDGPHNTSDLTLGVQHPLLEKNLFNLDRILHKVFRKRNDLAKASLFVFIATWQAFHSRDDALVFSFALAVPSELFPFANDHSARFGFTELWEIVFNKFLSPNLHHIFSF
jgi:hypothetical protein